jgi:hypothetical protein
VAGVVQLIVADAAVDSIGAFATGEAVITALPIEVIVATFAEDSGDRPWQADQVGAGRVDDRRPHGFGSFGTAGAPLPALGKIAKTTISAARSRGRR